MNWLLLLASAIVATVAWTVISVVPNYKAARSIGFPIVISPVSTLSPFWILTYRVFPSILTLKRLPFGLGTWARCTYMGWSFQDKHALHDELGHIFTIVTPGGNEVIVADPETAQTVFARRKDFIKPAMMYDQLNIFGPNVNTVEGDDWQRHRRLTAPSFNEKTSSVVWSEAIRQSQDMGRSWFDQGTNGTFETVSDTATSALHVLTCVGFGLTYPFSGGLRDLPAGHTMTYRDALSLCLHSILTFAIFPKKLLTSSFVPQRLRAVGTAIKEFQKYMEEMLSHERVLAEKQKGNTANLMSSLVRASDHAAGDDSKGSGQLFHGLTDTEIFGNIFVFNLAGHETTANAIAAALVLLAANPECQSWLAEEIHSVFAPNPDPKSWKYEDAFPQLKRCLAVMYETLRLYGSTPFIPRSTGPRPGTLTLPSKAQAQTHTTLPPNTSITINAQALHTDPATWGPDALTWRPNRWLSGGEEEEDLITPTPGTYVPWADGPRVCIARKFSQVEFVAVMATLFSRYQVRPKCGPGQGEAEGRGALMDMVHDSGIQAITLQMREPRRVALVWEERGGGGGV